MSVDIFLQETPYIDFSSSIVRDQSKALFKGVNSELEKVRLAFEFVRDQISHSIDVNASVVTAKASDVLKHKTGICHAKANLLAALLRSQKIPTGMCYQHITRKEDDSEGYIVHCFNAVHVGHRWIKLDARGNNDHINVCFSMHEPALAFANRPQYKEFFWPGIFARPHRASMNALETAKNIQELLGKLPDHMLEDPDILEIEAEDFRADPRDNAQGSSWFWF